MTTPTTPAGINVISACLFFDKMLMLSNPSVRGEKDVPGKALMYAAGVYELAISVHKKLPGWEFWLYVHVSSAQGVNLAELEMNNWCKIIRTDTDLHSMPLERFRPLFDQTVAHVLVVDTDNVLTDAIVKETMAWMTTGMVWLVNYPTLVDGEEALPRACYLAASPARPYAKIRDCFENKQVGEEWERDELWLQQMLRSVPTGDHDVARSKLVMNRRTVPAPTVKGYRKRSKRALARLRDKQHKAIDVGQSGAGDSLAAQ